MAKGTLNLNDYSDISTIKHLISLATQLFVQKAYLDCKEEMIRPELSILCDFPQQIRRTPSLIIFSFEYDDYTLIIDMRIQIYILKQQFGSLH